MAATAQEIQAWFQANPNATAQDIQQAMQSAGVTSEQLAQARNGGAYSQFQIQNWFQQNPNASPEDIELARLRAGLTPEQVSQYQPKQQVAPGTAPLQTPTNAYGLAGAENAILKGAQSGLNQLGVANQGIQGTFNNAQNQAFNTLQNTGNQVQNTFGNAQNQANNLFNDTRGQVGQTFTNANQQTGNIYNKTGAQIDNTFSNTGNQVQGSFNQGIQGLSPFAGTGKSANNLQADLTGANGPEAQSRAFAAYQESPGVDYARQQGERAITRNAAALGGLSGGNVMAELNRHAVGTYLQDFNNQFNRLGTVADRGANAQTNMSSLQGQLGGIQGQLGGQQAGLQGQLGANQANTLANLESQRANSLENLGTNQAGTNASLGQNLGSIQSGLGTTLSGIQSGLSSNLANIQQSMGQGAASIATGAGSQIGNLSYQAGNDLASNLSSTNSALANLINQEGAGSADIVGQGANNINQLIQLATQGDMGAKQQLATLLANVSSSSGSQYTNQPIIPGYQSNYLNQTGQVASGIGGLLAGLEGASA